jgi:HAD superfamily hydrolase (TIGR01509 family)
MIEGVIFDMDGVLVDSEKLICEAAIRMFAEHGVEARPEDFLPFVGAGENRYIGGPAEKYGFEIDIERDKARTYEIYAEVAKDRLEPLPGVHEFFRCCRERSLKLALATAADEIKMRVNLREIGLPAESFDACVHGLDVKRHKPDPEVFLLAAERLGVRAERCLVVEDAVNGVKAAKASGARCLALMTSFSQEQLAGADWHARTLADAPDAALDW